MAYTDDSPTTRLAAVRTAINSVLTAQSMGTSSRQVTLASLAELRKMERELMEEVNQSNQSGSMSSVGAMVRPT